MLIIPQYEIDPIPKACIYVNGNLNRPFLRQHLGSINNNCKSYLNNTSGYCAIGNKEIKKPLHN